MSKVYPFSLKDVARLLTESTAYKDEPIEFIHSRYEKYAKNFDEALEFLISLKLIRRKDGSLIAAQRLLKIEYPTTLEQIIKDALLRSSNFKDVHQLILKFQAGDAKFEYAPSRSERFVESDIRNLLISLGIIKYDRDRDIYLLEPNDYEEALNLYPDNHRKLSLRALQAIQAQKEAIGRKAEEIVLKYEKERLESNPELVAGITHVAEIDVAAGYDIESFDRTDNDTKRLIEVKAVSPFDFGFEWSINETRVAERTQNRYFLYLLPVINGLPNITDAVIIQDPFNKVMTGTEWKVDTAGYSVSLKSAKNAMDLDHT